MTDMRRYAAADISVTLERESGNAADSNAVVVIATVKGKGSYQIGYLPRYLAAVVAPLMDAHKAVAATFQEVRGAKEQSRISGLQSVSRYKEKPCIKRRPKPDTEPVKPAGADKTIIAYPLHKIKTFGGNYFDY